MNNGHGAAMPEKAKDFKATFKTLSKYLRQYWVGILLVLIFAVGGTAFSIVGPKISGNITTEIFNGLMAKISNTGGIDFTKIGKTVLFLFGLYAISALFSFIQGYVMGTISQKISYRLRKEISEKIHRLPMRYFDTKTHGEVLSRITNDVDTLSQGLNQSMTQLITSVTMLVGVVIMMLSISPTMTIAAFLILPISVGCMGFIVKKSQTFFVKQQKYLGDINGMTEELYGGHDIVKAFNAEEKSSQNFDEINETLYHTAWKSQFLSGMMHPIMSFIGNLGYVVVSMLGGYLTIKKKIEVGDIVSFIQYVRTFNMTIAQAAQIMNMFQSTAAAAERVFEFLNEEEEIPDVEKPVSTLNIDGNIEFDHVNFGYNENKTVINDFSASVKKGQKIAIVGPTGAGKSTMIKLLMRFYDVNGGAIKVDGHDIRDFNRSDLRKLFGMVLQDTWLFHGTIKDNIKYGKPDASEVDIEAACKAASVDHFVKTLPEGYDMELNEEADNISGGQKQLLTIARVILADPKILILDEATSNVDTRTELLIQNAMDHLMEGRTSFVIAHRLSTIKNADMILVMNQGDIVEQGSHNELLKKDGFYAKLYNSQFEEEEA